MYPKLNEKKIAIIIPDFDFGGEEKRVVFFLNNYINHFREVYLITPNGSSIANLNSKVKLKIVNVRNVFNIIEILFFLKKEKIDYLQGHKRITLPYLYLGNLFLGIATFFNFDNVYPKFNWLLSFISPKHIVYLSDIVYEFYLKYYRRFSNKVINMGGDFLNINSIEYNNKVKSKFGIGGEIVFISLGRLSKQKNHELLLYSLRKIDINFKCFIVGDGPLDEELKSLVLKCELEDKVIFLGHRCDIGDLLNASDILIQTSIFEGFPNVLIEAVSVGLPIVATNVGSTSSLVLDNGILVNCF